MSLITIGTDTELFAVDKTGKHRSLCGLIGGTKDNPLQINELPNGFCVQEDNVSLEFNVPPSRRSTAFVASIEAIMKYNEALLKKMNLSISKESSVLFEQDELTHPNALVFGCEPDYNAWLMIENPRPTSDTPTLRTAGGHVHVGTKVDMVHGVKAMDLFLGVPSVLLDDTESSRRRREMYGKAGALRPKPYGFEYRTLSNFWVFKPELVEWVYNATSEAMRHRRKINEKDSKLIQLAINKGDKDAAHTLIQSYGFALPTINA